MTSEEHFEKSERRPKVLFRDPDNGPLFGVCTGIAQYLGVEAWIIRLICVVGVFCIGWVVIPAYILAIFIMDRRPDGFEDPPQYNNRYRKSRKKRTYVRTKNEKVDEEFERPNSFNWRMNVVRREINKMDKKLQRMESYITSGRYELFKEFENLKD
ncbi:MAG: PspC domain-containing protein [Gammaproteobacteria bacterium]|nr:PspC domain-containing protein [Gammaproteobacteria bacterium]